LRNILVEEIGKENKALIYDSVFANDTTILNDGEKILSSCGLSILPPVCGG
jgi:molybdopterin converting factor small subunit